MSTARDLFTAYQVGLLTTLPMKDDIFEKMLIAEKFFSGDQLATMQAKETSAKRASFLLDDIINRDVEMYFPRLLKVMEAFDGGKNGTVSKLACKIQSELKPSRKRKSKSDSADVSPKKKSTPSVATSGGASYLTGIVDEKYEQVSNDEDGGATSNQNDDDEGTEKIINPDNGSGVVSDTTMTEIKGAVCLIRGSQGTGTGFIGRMKLNGKFTFVLMTNNHVFGDEDTAQGSSIEFQFLPHQPIYLSELIEEGQFFWTNPKKELDFSIVKINGEKLEEKLRKNDKSIIPINLCASASIKTRDYIRIIQHPHGGELSMSMSTCKVLDALLLYESGTHPGSSGSPVLKEINGMLAIVALHRGGREVDPNKDIKIGYNYATLFSEIQNCVSGKDYKKKPKVKKIQEFLDECESK